MNEEDIHRLVDAARGAMSSAYGVSSDGPRYGASVLSTSGAVYGAGQYRSETRQISLHAEQAAFVHAAAHSDATIVAIAIVSDEDPSGDAFTNPCGICKQAIYENALVSGLPMTVVLANLHGRFEARPLSEFIVFPWPAAGSD